MNFCSTPLQGAFVVELEPHRDARGGFARTFCEQEFAAHGLATHYPQTNLSWNGARHTLRGLHWQAAPHGEDKLVRCSAGAIYDVIVDLRHGSPSRLAWFGALLTAANRKALYVPRGCAHGFLTLEDDSEVSYSMSAPYVPAASRGLRFDDAKLGIGWPAPPAVISERDLALPSYDDALLYPEPP